MGKTVMGYRTCPNCGKSKDKTVKYHLKKDKTMTLTLTKKFINRIKKLEKENLKAIGGPKKEYIEEEKVLFRERASKGLEFFANPKNGENKKIMYKRRNYYVIKTKIRIDNCNCC